MAVQSSTIYAIQPVSAGDLIAAQFVNKLVAAVLDLDARVRALETKPAAAAAATPAGLSIRSAALATIGDTTVINVVGTGLDPAGLNSFRINTVAFTPLGNVLGDDEEIVIAIPPNADAQVLGAVRGAGFRAFTLTLGSKKGQSASAEVGGVRIVGEVLDPTNLNLGQFRGGTVTGTTQPTTPTGVGTTVGNVATNFDPNVATTVEFGRNFGNLATQFAASEVVKGRG